ncbi:MAG TPA: carboxypeptidase-like regulatory domain-containing protein, partial [Acidobacteriaceae bacterium]|nr:carboxypeptidase-like regulatory domain-containing protein [Acidobacteriaceae bacterium]
MNRLDRTTFSQLTTAVATLATLLCFMCLSLCAQQPSSQTAGWKGELHNASGNPIGGAVIELKSSKGATTANTAPDGSFSFHQLRRLRYKLSATVDGHRIESAQPIDLAASQADVLLTVTAQGTISVSSLAAAQEATGGVELSSKSVSQLPLNKRDFSQLLLLAAGTMTDANGATNFTQQFAINGQRG